jgi:molecular chaperone GrpE
LLAEQNNDRLDDRVSKPADVQDAESLAKLLAEEKEKADRYLANWQRSEADFRNYKAREEQEKKDLINWANSSLICEILPVLDAFDRAFEGVPPDDKNLGWINGFRQIQKMLLDVFSKHGVTEMKCIGEIFDPSRHEAVVQQDGAEGVVLGEIRKGYMMKDKLIRAPQVSVGKGGGTQEIKDDTKSEDTIVDENGVENR